MPFGYGPAAKLAALAARLRCSARLVFVGEGSALELISRTAGLFDEVIAANPASPAARPWLRGSAAVLSVMDRDAGVAAARAGLPLFVVDSLLWMRPEIPEPLRGAQAYFAQAFPGLDSQAFELRPLWVGPLTEHRRAAPAARRRGLVVHLGGSSAPDDRRTLFASYARLALRAVLEAGLAERFGRVTLIGGEPAVGALSDLADARVECLSLAPREARERTANAAALLTAPGLTATLEAFCDRTPTWFLPPQNYSQWCALRRLREQGVADGALHWEDLADVPRLDERLLPAQHAGPVSDAILRSARDPAVERSLAASLCEVGTGGPERALAQGAFFESLGPCGLDAVAATLARVTESAAPGREAGIGIPATDPRSPVWTS